MTFPGQAVFRACGMLCAPGCREEGTSLSQPQCPPGAGAGAMALGWEPVERTRPHGSAPRENLEEPSLGLGGAGGPVLPTVRVPLHL